MIEIWSVKVRVARVCALLFLQSVDIVFSRWVNVCEYHPSLRYLLIIITYELVQSSSGWSLKTLRVWDVMNTWLIHTWSKADSCPVFPACSGTYMSISDTPRRSYWRLGCCCALFVSPRECALNNWNGNVIALTHAERTIDTSVCITRPHLWMRAAPVLFRAAGINVQRQFHVSVSGCRSDPHRSCSVYEHTQDQRGPGEEKRTIKVQKKNPSVDLKGWSQQPFI